MKYLDINDLNAYRISFQLSNYIWNLVLKWDFFPKDTIGKQLVRAIDSISSNIAEGFGRYGKKDKINFYRYSYGSIKETIDWIEKAKFRNLLKKDEYLYIQTQLELVPREVNSLIKFTNEKLTI